MTERTYDLYLVDGEYSSPDYIGVMIFRSNRSDLFADAQRLSVYSCDRFKRILEYTARHMRDGFSCNRSGSHEVENDKVLFIQREDPVEFLKGEKLRADYEDDQEFEAATKTEADRHC